MATKNKDPLELHGLDPQAIDAALEAKKTGKNKAPTELDVNKEARLASKEKRLNSGPPTSTSKSHPPQLASEPEIDKSVLLDKLGAYRERFPHLKKRNNVSVKSSADDIMDEIHYCEVQLGSRQDGGGVGSMLLQGAMVGLETLTRDVWNPMGLNLTGLGKVTKDNMAEFQPIVDELMIKYGAGMYMSAEMRLALSLGALVMTVHGANSGDPRIAVALEKMNTQVKPPVGAKDL